VRGRRRNRSQWGGWGFERSNAMEVVFWAAYLFWVSVSRPWRVRRGMRLPVQPSLVPPGEDGASLPPMPSFFVDTSDGEHFVRDEIGLEVESLQSARDEAMDALRAMSQDMLIDGDFRELFAIIRDPSGRMLCKARMRIWCEWSD
jgi:hypothetical protein